MNKLVILQTGTIETDALRAMLVNLDFCRFARHNVLTFKLIIFRITFL